jgi:hypothetical protein
VSAPAAQEMPVQSQTTMSPAAHGLEQSPDLAAGPGVNPNGTPMTIPAHSESPPAGTANPGHNGPVPIPEAHTDTLSVSPAQP